MLVSAQESFGTIGGGELEYQCIRIAAERLQAARGGASLRRFPLGSNCGQCCGGVVDVLFEPLAGIACSDALLECWSNRLDAVLVTVIDTHGAPAKCLLDAHGNWHGDIAISAEVQAQANGMLTGATASLRLDTPGRAQPFLLLESIREPGFNIAVFGAGHVGSALANLLAGCDCRLRWVDSRRAVFPDTVAANLQCIESAEPAREVDAMPAGSYYLVMTHSHALDLDIIAAILRRGDFQYCGLIGSLTKRRRFEARLAGLGVSASTLRRLVCPIGISGISGKKPQEIAIAAAADVLRRRERELAMRQLSGSTVHTLNAQ
jgi:xanthine dehydrogenase accessory factor